MKNNSEVSSLHAQCEALIVAGKVPLAHAQLKQMNTAQIPRAYRLPLANLCRRVRLIGQGLRLLKPVVRGTDRPAASEAEKVEYAILLERAGSVTEALGLLATVDAGVEPQARFALASCHVGRWDYERALGLFADYVVAADTPYAKLIGRVNLGAAMVFTKRDQEALPAIDECLAQANELGAHRLAANAFELRAQLMIRAGKFGAARADLEKAAGLLGQSLTRDRLYIEKWRGVVTAHETHDVSLLKKIRSMALDLDDFETCRDLDFQTLQIAFDEKLYRHLYFGTPYEAYRENLRRSFGISAAGHEFVHGEGRLGFLDLATGEISGTSSALTAGGRTHLLCAILGRDFYGRYRPGTIFGELHPGEYFDIHSSPGRVRQAVARARRELRDAGEPVTIEQRQGSYFLSPAPGFGWSVNLATENPGRYQAWLLKLRERFAGRLFSASEASSALGLSAGRFRRFTIWALSENHCLKIGGGAHTLYSLPQNPVSERQTG